MNNIEENESLVHETLNMLDGQQKMGMNMPAPPSAAGMPAAAMPPAPMQSFSAPMQQQQPEWNANPMYAVDDGGPGFAQCNCKSTLKVKIGSLLFVIIMVFIPLRKWILMLLPLLHNKQILLVFAMIFCILIFYLLFMKAFDSIIPFWH